MRAAELTSMSASVCVSVPVRDSTICLPISRLLARRFFSASIHHIRAPFEPTRQTRRAYALATKKSDHPKSISGSC
jgi:hypothetical protein